MPGRTGQHANLLCPGRLFHADVSGGEAGLLAQAQQLTKHKNGVGTSKIHLTSVADPDPFWGLPNPDPLVRYPDPTIIKQKCQEVPVWIRGSGSVPKFHGSAALNKTTSRKRMKERQIPRSGKRIRIRAFCRIRIIRIFQTSEPESDLD